MKTSATAAAAAGNRQQQQQQKLVGGVSSGEGGEATMGGDSSLTEGDLPPTEDLRPEHVLR